MSQQEATECDGGDVDEHSSDQTSILTPRPLVTNDPVETSVTVRRVPVPPRPKDRLRLHTLWILVGIVGGALALVVAGMAFHWFDADFGKTLIQTVVSPVLGALAAVVGYLFAAEHRDSG